GHALDVAIHVHVIELNVVQHDHARVEAHEATVVLAALDHEVHPASGGAGGRQARGLTAYQVAGVFARGDHDLRQHGGGGGLAVSAGHAQVAVAAGEFAQGFRILHHADAAAFGLAEFGVVL